MKLSKVLFVIGFSNLLSVNGCQNDQKSSGVSSSETVNSPGGVVFQQFTKTSDQDEWKETQRRIHYNETGLPLKIIDPIQGSWEYIYDDNGRLKEYRLTDLGDAVVSVERIADGNIRKIILTTGGEISNSMERTYDDTGLILTRSVQTKMLQSGFEVYRYEDGKIVDAFINGSPNHHVRYRYEGKVLVEKSLVRPTGNKSLGIWEYNSDGKLIHSMRRTISKFQQSADEIESKMESTFLYDHRGRLKSIENHMISITPVLAGANEGFILIEYDYDANTQITRSEYRDQAGTTTLLRFELYKCSSALALCTEKKFSYLDEFEMKESFLSFWGEYQ